MSQAKLGEKLGLTYQQIQKYEKGINRIGASRLFDIAQVLGVTAQFFYEEAPSTPPRQFDEDDHADKAPETSIIEFPRGREGLELNRAFERISHAKARRAIIKLVRNLANQDASHSANLLRSRDRRLDGWLRPNAARRREGDDEL